MPLVVLAVAAFTAVRSAPPAVDSVGRRAVLCAAGCAPFALASAAHADAPPVSSSAMLTVGQWIGDVRGARKGLEEMKPLLELGEESGNEAVRLGLRKPPVNAIRKACSKVLIELEGSSLAPSKQKVYDDVKLSLGRLDEMARPGLQTPPAEAVQELGRLEALLDSFAAGLAPPPPPPPPPPDNLEPQ